MADENSDPFAEPAPIRRKKGLFNRTASNKAVVESADVDFFSRSREILPHVLKEKERQRHKKAAKLERKRSSTSASVDRKDTSSPKEKRRRISSNGAYSSDEEDDGRTRQRSTHSTPGSRKSQRSPTVERQPFPNTLSARYSKDLETKKRQQAVSKPAIITLTDSEDDDNPTLLPVRTASVRPASGEPSQIGTISKYKPIDVGEEDESEEEFPELVEAARERVRQKALQSQKSGQKFEQQNHTTHAGTASDEDIFQIDGPRKLADPVVEILIASEIANTKPLVVKRKLSGRLLEVKKNWCDRQMLNGCRMFPSIESQGTVFLSYLGKKLSEYTTCASLGLKLDADGKVISDAADSGSNGRVYLEAWTDSLFEQHKIEEEARSKREAEYSDGEEYIEPVVEVKRCRLILKSKNYGEHKLKADPARTFDRLIGAFRAEKGVPAHENITLQYDGDILEPDGVVGDMDFEDMDVIEVHIR